MNAAFAKQVAQKEWRFYSSPRNAMGRCNMVKDMCQKMEFNNSTECDALLAHILIKPTLYLLLSLLVRVRRNTDSPKCCFVILRNN